VVALTSKWKDKGHEIEVLMAGCSPTSCSPNLHVESGADVEERFLVSRWIMDRQSENSEISQSLEITNRHHAGAGTRQAINARIAQDSELTNTSHARRRLQNRRKQLHQKTAGIHNLQFSGERKAHAPLPAGAHVDHGVEVVVRGNHCNTAAGRGCHVAACSLYLLLYAD